MASPTNGMSWSKLQEMVKARKPDTLPSTGLQRVGCDWAVTRAEIVVDGCVAVVEMIKSYQIPDIFCEWSQKDLSEVHAGCRGTHDDFKTWPTQEKGGVAICVSWLGLWVSVCSVWQAALLSPRGLHLCQALSSDKCRAEKELTFAERLTFTCPAA